MKPPANFETTRTRQRVPVSCDRLMVQGLGMTSNEDPLDSINLLRAECHGFRATNRGASSEAPAAHKL
jgi:hypothetical protein